jgi:hypothetical protein
MVFPVSAFSVSAKANLPEALAVVGITVRTDKRSTIHKTIANNLFANNLFILSISFYIL